MQLLCDTHSHTIASTHAYSTVHDYVRDAKRAGLKLFSITDHAVSMPDAPHPWHFGNMRIIPRVIEGIAVLRGIESNILSEPYQGVAGRYVDIPDGMLPFLDIVLASFHEPVFAPASKQENTRAMIRAIESGVVQIIGHPGNPNYPIEQEDVIRAAKDNNVALEINNSSFTLSRSGSAPYCQKLIELIDKHNWKIAVGSDAHISFDVGNFAQAQQMLKQAGFNEENIITQTPQRLLAFLAEHGKSAGAELNDWLTTLNE